MNSNDDILGYCMQVPYSPDPEREALHALDIAKQRYLETIDQLTHLDATTSAPYFEILDELQQVTSELYSACIDFLKARHYIRAED